MALTDGVKKKLKVGASAVGGGGILVIALQVMNARIDSIKDAVDAKEAKVEAIVEYKHQSVITELKHINAQLQEANQKIDRIDQRVYDLKQKSISAIVPETENHRGDNYGKGI